MSLRPLALASALLLGMASPSSSSTADPAAPSPARPFVKGMTVSCPTWGPVWGSPRMEESLAELGELGVEWVAIHPYAGVRRDGSIRYTPAAELGFLSRAVELAEAAGIQMFWKPHLAYWGSFEWRGDIAFGDDKTRWRRFFDDYRAFIVDQAAFAEAAGVPLFAVGLEYESTTQHDAEWRRIIAEVRRVYSGRITYSANWDRLGDVPFWDDLDLISVQGYFPLSAETYPTREAIGDGWNAPLKQLRTLSQRHGKPVLFAELGYDLSSVAATEPWRTDTHDTRENRDLRRRLMEVALERLAAEPFIEGLFWWKWIPGQRGYHDFAMQHPDAREILRRAWGS
ncbi:MAG: hypothetical protein AAGD06_27650 [Acidobacteriota bacterium]